MSIITLPLVLQKNISSFLVIEDTTRLSLICQELFKVKKELCDHYLVLYKDFRMQFIKWRQISSPDILPEINEESPPVKGRQRRLSIRSISIEVHWFFLEFFIKERQTFYCEKQKALIPSSLRPYFTLVEKYQEISSLVDPAEKEKELGVFFQHLQDKNPLLVLAFSSVQNQLDSSLEESL